MAALVVQNRSACILDYGVAAIAHKGNYCIGQVSVEVFGICGQQGNQLCNGAEIGVRNILFNGVGGRNNRRINHALLPGYGSNLNRLGNRNGSTVKGGRSFFIERVIDGSTFGCAADADSGSAFHNAGGRVEYRSRYLLHDNRILCGTSTYDNRGNLAMTLCSVNKETDGLFGACPDIAGEDCTVGTARENAVGVILCFRAAEGELNPGNVLFAGQGDDVSSIEACGRAFIIILGSIGIGSLVCGKYNILGSDHDNLLSIFISHLREIKCAVGLFGDNRLAGSEDGNFMHLATIYGNGSVRVDYKIRLVVIVLESEGCTRSKVHGRYSHVVCAANNERFFISGGKGYYVNGSYIHCRGTDGIAVFVEPDNVIGAEYVLLAVFALEFNAHDVLIPDLNGKEAENVAEREDIALGLCDT